MERLTRQCGTTSSRKRQAGAETVEFALTLILFFIVFFLIIDMAIAMYDKGAITNAARYSVRQGSLYWVDPSDFQLDPCDNIRLNTDMIVTAKEYLEKTVVNPGRDQIQFSDPSLKPTPPTPTACGNPVVPVFAGSKVWKRVIGSQIPVTLSYPHDFLGLTGLLKVAGWSLGAKSELKMEAGKPY